ncbi:MAG: phenylalanine--tRNA ligase subunit alpha [Armatimonadota bacterium]|jgi:phenylalanyl-tRNA synthetase alpha chain
MEDEVRTLWSAAGAAIEGAGDTDELERTRVEYLGRKGKLAALRRGLGKLPADERPVIGRLVNEAIADVEAALEQRRASLAAAAADAALEAERIDVTLPGRAPRIGRLHPLTESLHEMVDIFLRLGFSVAEGPEVETYYYSFESLNYPPHHPAMDEQMTFYVSQDVLLRSQTSTVQIRYMEQHDPPVRVIVPGRCFRRDTVDATHCHTFYQLEGLLVDEGVTFADLKGTLNAFAKAMYGERISMRFRPDFFPFTEPSAEIALTCIMCEGAGCRVCSETGWLEVGGSGMVDPAVLVNVGYDPETVSGWAFGFGIDRLAMLRYGIRDIRSLYGDAPVPATVIADAS